MDHDIAPPHPVDNARPQPHPFTLELRRRRVLKSLSQNNLARLSGVSAGWIRILEQGHYADDTAKRQPLPNPEHTVRLARALDWDDRDALATVGHDPDVIPEVELPSLVERIGRLTPGEAKLVERAVTRVLQEIRQPAAS